MCIETCSKRPEEKKYSKISKQKNWIFFSLVDELSLSTKVLTIIVNKKWWKKKLETEYSIFLSTVAGPFERKMLASLRITIIYIYKVKYVTIHLYDKLIHVSGM